LQDFAVSVGNAARDVVASAKHSSQIIVWIGASGSGSRRTGGAPPAGASAVDLIALTRSVALAISEIHSVRAK